MTESAPTPDSIEPSPLAKQYLLNGLAEKILLEEGVDTFYETVSPVAVVRKLGLGARLGSDEEDKL